METEKKPDRKPKRLRRWLAGIGGVLLAAAAVIILIGYNPRDYAPIVPDNPHEVSPYLTHKLGPDFYNNVQLDEPFELIVDQAGVNDIFSRCPWPMEAEGFSIYMPVVTFSPERTVLMAQVDYKGFSSVLSLVGQPSLDAEGKLNLNIQSVYLGALPITPLAERAAKIYVEKHFNPSDFDPGDPSAAAIQAMISNQPFDPILFIADHTARITGLKVEPAQARLILTPVANPVGKGS